jgi:ribose 5-phosphate isomerase B
MGYTVVMKIYFGADHAGFELKRDLIAHVQSLGYEAEDCGALTLDPQDDYPSFIAAAARKLSLDAQAGSDSRAIVIGASGQGEAIVANRFKSVRCALYYGAGGRRQVDLSGKELNMLASTREHNDANTLSLGARFLSTDEAKDVVGEWLKTPFSGEERHLRRIKQIDEVSA